VAVHAEDDGLVREATDRVRAAGRRDPGAWLASRPGLAEVRAVGRACAAAAGSGARLHIVHLSAADALGAIGVARAAGTDVSAETCPHYLVFDEADVLVRGPLLKCAPPIRGTANRDALWDAVQGGRIDLIASDHSPCPALLKARGNSDIFAAWGGISGVQSLLPAVFTEALRRAGGALDVRAVAGFVAWRLAAKPAERFGLGPQKGRIAAGADADIVLFDPDRQWTLEPDAVQTRSRLTPYAGRRFTGAVVRTIVRGTTVFNDGAFPAAPGHGRFISAERAA
jgi:allantoinase